MGRQLTRFVAAAALAGSALCGAASAGPMTGFAGLASANTALSPIEKTQFVWGAMTTVGTTTVGRARAGTSAIMDRG
jgi:hypothetical protein